MSREIDERKKRKALRKLRKAAELAERGEGPPLSDWEREFLEEVEERIKTYGSAFADPDKGNLEDPMSALQTQKLKEIDKKARGKGGGFRTRKPLGAKKKPAYTPRVRQIDDDIEDEATAAPPAEPQATRPAFGVIRGSELKNRPATETATREEAHDKPGRPAFRVIKGGRDDA